MFNVRTHFCAFHGHVPDLPASNGPLDLLLENVWKASHKICFLASITSEIGLHGK